LQVFCFRALGVLGAGPTACFKYSALFLFAADGPG